MEYGWAYLVPVVAIAGGITFAIFNQYFKTRRQIAETKGSPELKAALTRSNDLNTELLEGLSAVNIRLSAIERTLNEVG